MAGFRQIEQLGSVKLKGHPRDGLDLSAVGVVGDFLLVAGDETDRVEVLRRQGDHYQFLPDHDVLVNNSEAEADIEGIACEGDTVYVAGSHSCTRSKTKSELSVPDNHKRLEVPKPLSPFRSVLARFRFTQDGTHSNLETTTLSPVIEGTKVLQPFTHIPCKENGIDIEGLAVRDKMLYVGFRGPVLQHGLVPVLTCPFAGLISAANVLYLNLGGRGIRDLECVEDGFLLLAGPVSDVRVSFQLYFWNGEDCLPGSRTDGVTGKLLLLDEIPTPEGAKAEGLAVEKETKDSYEVLVLFDGLHKGGSERFRVHKDDRIFNVN